MTPEEIEKLIKFHVEKLKKQIQKEIEEKFSEHEERYKHEHGNDPWYY